MSEFHLQYKKKTLGFGNSNESRLIRAEKKAEERKDRRAETFAKARDVSEGRSCQQNVNKTTGDDKLPQLQKRLSKLERWKAERDLRKKMEQQKKKPVFKVGIVHHGVGSPIFQSTELPGNKLCKLVKKQPSPPRRVTRATEKRLEAINRSKFTSKQPLGSKNVKPTGRKLIKDVTDTSGERIPKILPNNKNPSESFAPKNYKFKGPVGLPTIPMFGQAIEQTTHGIENEKENVEAPTVPSIQSERPEKDTSASKTLPLDNVEIREAVSAPDNSQNEKSDDESNSFQKKICVAGELTNGAEIEILKANSAFDKESSPLSDSSIEAITLRLSPEQLERLDCPAKKGGSPSCDRSRINSSLPVGSDLSNVPAAFYSPYVVTSRGKSSARKEEKERRGIRRSSQGEIPTKDTVMDNLNISVEMEEKTAQYFKFVLNREVERLTSLCTKWQQVKSEPQIPEDARYLINQAVGQTNLLMSKKFQRFKNLVSDCEHGKGQMLVTCRDLQGFWDMMHFGIDDCDSRFQKLDELRSKGWVEEEHNEPIERDKKNAKKKGLPKRKVEPKEVKSSMRAMIMEARKRKLKQAEGKSKGEIIIMAPKVPASPLPSNPVEFDGGFFKIQSPVKSRVPKTDGTHTPQNKSPRSSLLHQVQISEAAKTAQSPLAVMKVAQMYKTPEVRLDESITYVNSDQTPGKSILKRAESDHSAEMESRSKKSLCKVNFNDTAALNEVQIDEEEQNKLDLAAALAKIDSYYSEEEDEPVQTNNKVEKKLLFEDESFEEPVEIETANCIPQIAVTSPTPRKKNTSHDTARQAHFTAATTSPQRRLRSRKQDPLANSKQETKTSEVGITDETASTKKEKRMIQRGKRKHIETETPDVVKEPQEDFKDRRKSSRRSVKFTGDECLVCTENKPVHPMTPFARRSKKRLSGTINAEPVSPPANEKDLIIWDTPTQIPSRVRRSGRIAKMSKLNE